MSGITEAYRSDVDTSKDAPMDATLLPGKLG
jgi:hypothetical protein